MAQAKKREFKEDHLGVGRLVAAPGDDKPGDDVHVGPYGVTMAPQNWDDKARQFKADPVIDEELGNDENLEESNADQSIREQT